MRAAFKFDDWTDDDFFYVGDWLVDCARVSTASTSTGADFPALPSIGKRKSTTFTGRRFAAASPCCQRANHHHCEPGGTTTEVSRFVAVPSHARQSKSAFRETITTLDESKIMFNENMEVNKRSLVEIEVPGNFVTQHVAGIHAMECVPLRIDPLMRDLVEQFGTDAKKRRKIGWKLERDGFAIHGDLDHADALGGEPFYLNYQTDYRGRLIPTSHLHFARDDRVRSLFRSPTANGWAGAWLGEWAVSLILKCWSLTSRTGTALSTRSHGLIGWHGCTTTPI